MKKKCKQVQDTKLLSFHIIQAASKGDAALMDAVLKHYKKYIMSLCTRRLFDEFRQPYYCVDETLRQRLETRLIERTLKFTPERYCNHAAMNQ